MVVGPCDRNTQWPRPASYLEGSRRNAHAAHCKRFYAVVLRGIRGGPGDHLLDQGYGRFSRLAPHTGIAYCDMGGVGEASTMDSLAKGVRSLARGCNGRLGNQPPFLMP